VPFENIYLSSVSWFGFFLSIHWWVWFLTSFSFPILIIPNCLVSRYGMWIPAWRVSSPHYQKYPLSNRPLYRPSASGVRVVVWYLHLVLHLIVVIRVSQALVFSSQWPVEQFWISCFVWRLGLLLSWIPRGLSTLPPAATMFEWPWLYAWPQHSKQDKIHRHTKCISLRDESNKQYVHNDLTIYNIVHESIMIRKEGRYTDR